MVERTPVPSPVLTLVDSRLEIAASTPTTAAQKHPPPPKVVFAADLEQGTAESTPLLTKDDSEDNNDDDNTDFAVATTILEHIEETIGEQIETAREHFHETSHYDWRDFWNWEAGGVGAFLRWIATGATPTVQDDDAIQENLNSLARLLSLLREYYERFGLPEKGGPRDQEYVLREVTKDLYLGGAPIWALEPVMKRVAEGLTGQRGVDFFMLPRRVFIFAPSSGATSMFATTRGYDMQRLDEMETVAVRLASFASNTKNPASLASRWPQPHELRLAFRTESLADYHYSQEELAEEILNLASEAEGLFFYINSAHMRAVTRELSPNNHVVSPLGDFWTVEDNIRDLFRRLAAIEAVQSIDTLDAQRKPLYSKAMIAFFRVGSSAGACAFWFNGSWSDIFVSGVLAVMVASIGSSSVLNKQERIIFEAVASLAVGLIAGLIALTWPQQSCFSAMAISGVLDLLQGFRVVYSIIEIMSRHTVTGGADFLEGVFFTTLIAYFLRFGEYIAVEILGRPGSDEYRACDNGISEWWYLFFVPLAAICWSGLFNPNYFDLPFMAAHGILGYLVSWQFYAGGTTNLNNFVAAMVVTFSSGLVSRFMGRQALANTVAGLYVLLPGAYLVSEVYSDKLEGFLTTIILRAVIIGIGAWSGTILCSPTLLGMNKGLVQHSSVMPSLVAPAGSQAPLADAYVSTGSLGSNAPRRRDRSARVPTRGSLLFF